MMQVLSEYEPLFTYREGGTEARPYSPQTYHLLAGGQVQTLSTYPDPSDATDGDGNDAVFVGVRDWEWEGTSEDAVLFTDSNGIFFRDNWNTTLLRRVGLAPPYPVTTLVDASSLDSTGRARADGVTRDPVGGNYFFAVTTRDFIESVAGSSVYIVEWDGAASTAHRVSTRGVGGLTAVGLLAPGDGFIYATSSGGNLVRWPITDIREATGVTVSDHPVGFVGGQIPMWLQDGRMWWTDTQEAVRSEFYPGFGGYARHRMWDVGGSFALTPADHVLGDGPEGRPVLLSSNDGNRWLRIGQVDGATGEFWPKNTPSSERTWSENLITQFSSPEDGLPGMGGLGGLQPNLIPIVFSGGEMLHLQGDIGQAGNSKQGWRGLFAMEQGRL